jgi:hypothetical protein
MGISVARFRVRKFWGVGAASAVVALFLAVFCAAPAKAIPAFSRELKTECTTCHTIFPQLNEFGQAFEKNGFVWPGGVEKSKKIKISQTEEERKSAEYINLSGLPAVLPVSAMLGVSYLYDEKKEDNFDQKFFSAQILAAGTFGGDRIGFWFNESLGNQDTTRTNSLAGPSQVWFVARHPFGVPVHLKAGRFAPDVTLFNATLNGRPLSAGASVENFSVTAAQSGVELSAFLGPRVLAVFGVNDRTNAVGKDAAGKDLAAKSVNDFYGRVAVKIGGADFDGKEPDVDLEKDSVWDFLSINVSAFGYSGTQSGPDHANRDLTRFGAEAEVAYKKLLLMLGATLGKNDTSATPIDSTALSAEVDYVHNPMFAVALRYDRLDIDGRDLRTVVTPGVIYAPFQSVKFRLNAAIDSNPSGAVTDKAVKNTTVSLAATLAF